MGVDNGVVIEEWEGEWEVEEGREGINSDGKNKRI